jgi:predicted Zn-dependent protease
LQHALARLPEDDKLQLALARDEFSLGHLEDAASLLQHFTVRHPDNPEALYLLGNAYLHLSESTFGKLQTTDPNSVYSEEVAGEIDESMRNYPGAIVEYNKAVAQAPAKPGTHMHLANVLWLSNQWAGAEQEFRAELKNDPYNCQAAWKLGDSMLQADAPANQALESLSAAIAKCPNLMQARVDRARVLIKDGRAAEALDDLRAAEQQTPSEPSIHFLLAQVYKAKGTPADAAHEMQVYAQLQAASSKAAEEDAAAQKAAAPGPN